MPNRRFIDYRFFKHEQSLWLPMNENLIENKIYRIDFFQDNTIYFKDETGEQRTMLSNAVRKFTFVDGMKTIMYDWLNEEK